MFSKQNFPFYRKLPLFLSLRLMGIFAPFFILSCNIAKDDEARHKGIVRINNSFTFQDVNELASIFPYEKIPLEKGHDSLQLFINRYFTKNKNKEKVSFGQVPGAEYGWVYLNLKNTSDAEKKLATEIIYRRSEGLKAYLLNEGNLTYIGSVNRTTPLSKRFYHNFDLAFPLVIPSQKEVGLLIQSKRFTGLHDVGLVIQTEDYYLTNAIKFSYFKVIQLTLLTIISIAALLVGLFFKNRLFISLSLFIFALAVTVTAYLGYFDAVSFSPNFALNSGNIAGFMNLIANASFHPFGFFLVKGILKFPKLYKTFAGILMVQNLALALTYFLPPNYFVFVNNYIYYLIMYLANANILWIFFFAILYLIRGKSKWFLIGALATLSPFLIRHTIELFSTQGFKLYNELSFVSPYFLIAAFIYLSFVQLKSKLILKSVADETLSKLTSSLHELNNNEITKIGRNLHDQVGNTLATALEYLNLKKDSTIEAKGLILLAINELRVISHNIVRSNTTIYNTVEIEKLILRMNDFSSINYYFKDYSDNQFDKLSDNQKQNTYAIIQELLTNILKHSGATEVFVEIYHEKNKIRVNVEDNGKGYDTSKEYAGIGLTNIQSRVALLDFHYFIESTDKGTSVFIEIAYEN